MWTLRHANGSLIHLSRDSKITIGRTGCDLTINDATVSHVHATIRVKRKNGFNNNHKSKFSSTCLIVDEGSTQGTKFYGKKKFMLLPGKSYKLKPNDQVRFGAKDSVWTVSYSKILLLTCGDCIGNVKWLNNIIRSMGGKVYTEWNKSCNYFSSFCCRVTPKFVGALAAGLPFVTLKYWEDFFDAFQSRREFPDPTAYNLTDWNATEELKQVSLYPQAARKRLFDGLEFVFFSIIQIGHYAQIIELAGGRALMYGKYGFEKAQLLKANTIIVACNEITRAGNECCSIDYADYTDIRQSLVKARRKMIFQEEIFKAILLCSREKYCDPKLLIFAIRKFNGRGKNKEIVIKKEKVDDKADVTDKRAEVADKGAVVADKIVIKDVKKAVVKKKAVIADKEDVVADKRAEVVDKGADVAHKIANIDVKKAVLKKKAVIADKEDVVVHKRAKLAGKNVVVRDKAVKAPIQNDDNESFIRQDVADVNKKSFVQTYLQHAGAILAPRTSSPCNESSKKFMWINVDKNEERKPSTKPRARLPIVRVQLEKLSEISNNQVLPHIRINEGAKQNHVDFNHVNEEINAKVIEENKECNESNQLSNRKRKNSSSNSVSNLDSNHDIFSSDESSSDESLSDESSSEQFSNQESVIVIDDRLVHRPLKTAKPNAKKRKIDEVPVGKALQDRLQKIKITSYFGKKSNVDAGSERLKLWNSINSEAAIDDNKKVEDKLENNKQISNKSIANNDKSVQLSKAEGLKQNADDNKKVKLYSRASTSKASAATAFMSMQFNNKKTNRVSNDDQYYKNYSNSNNIMTSDSGEDIIPSGRINMKQFLIQNGYRHQNKNKSQIVNDNKSTSRILKSQTRADCRLNEETNNKSNEQHTMNVSDKVYNQNAKLVRDESPKSNKNSEVYQRHPIVEIINNKFERTKQTKNKSNENTKDVSDKRPHDKNTISARSRFPIWKQNNNNENIAITHQAQESPIKEHNYFSQELLPTPEKQRPQKSDFSSLFNLPKLRIKKENADTMENENNNAHVQGNEIVTTNNVSSVINYDEGSSSDSSTQCRTVSTTNECSKSVNKGTLEQENNERNEARAVSFNENGIPRFVMSNSNMNRADESATTFMNQDRNQHQLSPNNCTAIYIDDSGMLALLNDIEQEVTLSHSPSEQVQNDDDDEIKYIPTGDENIVESMPERDVPRENALPAFFSKFL